MSSPARTLLIAGCIAGLASACASGRVRGLQGTEMKQAEEYEAQQKVDPPTGNVHKTSAPLEPIDTYPALEVDLERRPPRPGPEPEPEPEPKSKPETESGKDPD